MEGVVVVARINLCVILLFFLSVTSAQGARTLSAGVQGDLPPCKDVPGGIPGWNCFDPPTHDLPPCDFKHQRVGIDCWPKSPPPTLSGRVQGELPPCKDVWGEIPDWDCFDPPLTPLPPCDFKHQNPGIDCNTDSQKPRPPPVASTTTAATNRISTAGAASVRVPVQGGAYQVKAMLPPCKDVWGGIPGWDCFDPPLTPLPPCDFKHQRAGFDCWPRDPPAARP